MAKLLRLLATTLAILVGLQAHTVWRVWQLRLTNRCPGCNLVGATLKGLDLRQADLRNADLRWATLKEIRLDGADLSGANLRHARLEEVTVSGTNFCRAIMTNAVGGYCLTPAPTHLSQTEQTR
ncbi:MAG: pentapeptide repeat-containing protein [Nodosilinea sp.]